VSCASSTTLSDTPSGQYTVDIAPDIALNLPANPNSKETVNETQIIVGSYDGNSKAFRTHFLATPDQIDVVIVAFSGPRIIDVTWSDKGIVETRSPFAPDTLSGLNILADLFLVRWPEAALERALPADISVNSEGNARRIQNVDDVLVSINYDLRDDKDKTYTRLENHARNYVLNIYRD
jgi:hypothetical protein